MAPVKELERNRPNARAGKIRAFVRKDLLFERASPRMALAWGACSSAGLFLSRYQADMTLAETLTESVASPAISSTSQFFLLFSMMGAMIVPVLTFMFLIQAEKTNGSFLVYRTIPVSCHTLFWSRVLSCWLLAMSCELMLYLFYGLFLLFGIVDADALTPTIFGFSYIFLLFSLCVFVSVCSIALTFNVPAQLLPIAVTALSVFMVIIPFIFSERVAGFDGQGAILSYFIRYGVMGGVSFILLLLSLLIGGLGSWAFKLKRAYV